MPTFFVDEYVALAITQDLRMLGFDVVDAKDVCRGDSDEWVLALAAASGRIVVTHDWGFGEMTIRHGQSAAGVIILALYSLSAGYREQYSAARIAEIADTAPGHLTIIEPGRIRTRPLPVG